MVADSRACYGAAPSAAGPSSARKRKHADYAATSSTNISYLSASKQNVYASVSHSNTQTATPPKKTRIAKPAGSAANPPEKRLRRFRPQPPKSFHEIYHRATTQRFYVLSRTRYLNTSLLSPNGFDDDVPEETVELTGSTGNIYTVVIARQPRCDCPHAREGNQCKHVVYVLARVLRAKYEYVYQLALLGGELREIFEGAPPIGGDNDGGGGGGDAGGDGRRKPVEGDCPICFCEMEAERGEPVVWCRAACGQNIHKGCFETWAATKRRQAAGGGSGEVTCPYCRSVWEGDEDMVKMIKRHGKRNADGYVNVASQLGISTRRDYSTYSKWWSGHPSSYRRRWY